MNTPFSLSNPPHAPKKAASQANFTRLYSQRPRSLRIEFEAEEKRIQQLHEAEATIYARRWFHQLKEEEKEERMMWRQRRPEVKAEERFL